MSLRVRRLVAWFAFAAPLFALYLLLVDKAPFTEQAAGIVCAVLSSGAALLGVVAGRVSVAIEPRWALRALRAPWWIVRDSVLVSLSALRLSPPRGRFRVLAFPPAGGKRPRDVGRRVMVKGPGSAGANLYVVGGDEERGLLLVHELLHRGDAAPLEVVRT